MPTISMDGQVTPVEVKFDNNDVLKVMIDGELAWQKILELRLPQLDKRTSIANYISLNNPNNVKTIVVMNDHVQPTLMSGDLSGLTVTLLNEHKGQILGDVEGASALIVTSPMKLTNLGKIYGAGGHGGTGGLGGTGGVGGKGGTGKKGSTGHKGADIAASHKTVHTGTKYTWRGNHVGVTSSTNANYTAGKTGSFNAQMGGGGWRAAISFSDRSKWWGFKLSGPCGKSVELGVDPRGKIMYFKNPCDGRTGWIRLQRDRHFQFHSPSGSWQASHRVNYPKKVGGAGGAGGNGGNGGAGGAGGAGGIPGAGGTGAHFGLLVPTAGIAGHSSSNGVAGHAGYSGANGHAGSASRPSGGHSGSTGGKGGTGAQGGTGGKGGLGGHGGTGGTFGETGSPGAKGVTGASGVKGHTVSGGGSSAAGVHGGSGATGKTGTVGGYSIEGFSFLTVDSAPGTLLGTKH